MVVHPLTYPMAAMVLLTFVVLNILFVTRVLSVKKGLIDARYFKTYNVGSSTLKEIQASRHYSNLFELPVLFYAGCLLAMVQGRESQLLVGLAWAFVA